MDDLKLAVSRLHKLDGTGPTKAFCDISILDSLVINGLRLSLNAVPNTMKMIRSATPSRAIWSLRVFL